MNTRHHQKIWRVWVTDEYPSPSKELNHQPAEPPSKDTKSKKKDNGVQKAKKDKKGKKKGKGKKKKMNRAEMG